MARLVQVGYSNVLASALTKNSIRRKLPFKLPHAHHNPLSRTIMVGPKAVRYGHGGHFLTLRQAKGPQSSSQEGKKPEKLNNPMRELKIQVCSASVGMASFLTIIETRPEHLRRRIWRQTDARRKSAGAAFRPNPRLLQSSLHRPNLCTFN